MHDDSNDIVIHTDGSGNLNTPTIGWSFNAQFAGRLVSRSGFKHNASNNEAEFTAVLRALQFIKPTKHPIVLYTDSEYVRNTLNVWADSWERQGWNTNMGKPVKNLEIIQEIMKLLRWHRTFRRVTIHWIQGHCGHQFNEMADKDARAARVSCFTDWTVPDHLPNWVDKRMADNPPSPIKARHRTRRPVTGRETIISPCGKYRYTLWRVWDASKPYVVFVGLNPSTADATVDDPTIKRCVSFAKSWGFGALCMVNLFAFRATKPTVMAKAKDPIGPDNDAHLKRILDEAPLVVAAWGPTGTLQNRNKVILERFPGRFHCLAVTKDGHPGHPLYLKGDLTPQPYPPAATRCSEGKWYAHPESDCVFFSDDPDVLEDALCVELGTAREAIQYCQKNGIDLPEELAKR